MNKKSVRHALLVAVAATLAPAAHAGEYGTVVADKSRLTFVSKQMGVPVDGAFGKFNAQLAFDPARLETAKAQIEVELASVDAGSADANEELTGKNWFNVRQHPTARFVSNGVKSLGSGRYEASGTLSIKGKTLPVSAPFTFRNEGSNGVFDGGFVLKRTAYGIGEGVWGDTDTVADEVQIKFRLVTTAK